jgi:hypothetical protein
MTKALGITVPPPLLAAASEVINQAALALGPIDD